MRETFRCPRCNRTLKRAGELCADGHTLPLDTFPCDECMGEFKIGASTFPTAFTFAVTPNGQILDGATGRPMER